MKNPSVKQAAAIYYHVPPQAKISQTQIISEIKNIQDLCRGFGWKPIKTFVDYGVHGSMYDTMRAYVADPDNGISSTICYTAGDCLTRFGGANIDKTSDVYADTAETVKFTGGVPFGYTVDGGALVIDIDNAAVVLEIFKAKTKGDSLQRIADILNKKSIKSSRGGEWSKAAISFILKNPAYTGQYRYNGNTIKIPAIIDSQLYHKANA